MSSTQTTPWITGWTAEEPLQIGYTDVPHDGGTWEKGLRDFLEYRDLGLAGVTDGKMGVQHIRTTKAPDMGSDWHCHDLDFQFFYVVAGSITIETAHGEVVTLGPGDTGYHPPLYFHREYDISPDYEVMEITAPAVGKTYVGRDAELPERAASLDPERRPVYTREAEESYVMGNGPRKFFKYRDLGTREPTEGRIHIHIVRGTGTPGEGTGWHYHSMAQWFLILGGSSDIRVETGPRRHLVPGDTMCIGAGPDMRHNVAPFSGDYAVLEMCVPAEYETIAVDPPEGSAD